MCFFISTDTANTFTSLLENWLSTNTLTLTCCLSPLHYFKKRACSGAVNKDQTTTWLKTVTSKENFSAIPFLHTVQDVLLQTVIKKKKKKLF